MNKAEFFEAYDRLHAGDLKLRYAVEDLAGAIHFFEFRTQAEKFADFYGLGLDKIERLDPEDAAAIAEKFKFE